MAGLNLKIEGNYRGVDISYSDSVIQGSRDANSFMEMLEVMDELLVAHCYYMDTKLENVVDGVDINFGIRNISTVDGTAVVELFDGETSIAVGSINFFEGE